jgi:hypothetical protein
MQRERNRRATGRTDTHGGATTVDAGVAEMGERDGDVRGESQGRSTVRRRSKRATTGRARMSVRTWAIAHRYYGPADYGIPELPEWEVDRTERGGLALADEGDPPFISAEHPVRVRR